MMKKTMLINDPITEMAHLNTQLAALDVRIKNNLAPVSLTPYFLSHSDFIILKTACEEMLSAIEISLRLYVEDKDFQAQFPELNAVRELSCITPPYK